MSQPLAPQRGSSCSSCHPSRVLPEYCHHCCWFSPLSSSDRAGKWVGWRSSRGSAPQLPGVWLGRERRKISDPDWQPCTVPSRPLRLALMSPINPSAPEHILVLNDFYVCSGISEVELPGCRRDACDPGPSKEAEGCGLPRV